MLFCCDLLAFDGGGEVARRPAASALAIFEYDVAKAVGREFFHTLTAVHSKRRDKEGWIHWYVGAPIFHPHIGAQFAFVGGEVRFGACPLSTTTGEEYFKVKAR